MSEGYKNFADAIMWCLRLFYSMRTTFFLEGIANDFSQVADSVFSTVGALVVITD